MGPQHLRPGLLQPPCPPSMHCIHCTGFKVTLGWLLTPTLAVITVMLLAMYEVCWQRDQLKRGLPSAKSCASPKQPAADAPLRHAACLPACLASLSTSTSMTAT